jgi:hypothetical protein
MLKRFFERNLGNVDRVLRILLAVVCITLAFFIDISVLEFILILVSLFTLYEGVFGWCALYAVLGIKTCPVEKKG